MRLVRFLARSFHNDTIVEPGTEMLVSDDTVLSPHMVDVASDRAPPNFPTVPPVFRGDLAPSAALEVAEPVVAEEPARKTWWQQHRHDLAQQTPPEESSGD